MIDTLILDFDKSPEKVTYEDLFHYKGKKRFSHVRSIEAIVNTNDLTLSFLAPLFPNLEKLRLNNSTISTIRDIGCTFPKLKFLSLAHSNISSLDGIGTISTSLQELYLAGNHIPDLVDLMGMDQLKIVDLEDNGISSFSTIEILSFCEKLTTLTLRNNPISIDPKYKKRVFELIPNLVYLDEARPSNAIPIKPPPPIKVENKENVSTKNNNKIERVANKESPENKHSEQKNNELKEQIVQKVQKEEKHDEDKEKHQHKRRAPSAENRIKKSSQPPQAQIKIRSDEQKQPQKSTEQPAHQHRSQEKQTPHPNSLDQPIKKTDETNTLLKTEKDQKDNRNQIEHKEQKEQREHKEQKEQREQKEQKEQREQREQKEQREQRKHREQKEQKEYKEYQEQKEGIDQNKPKDHHHPQNKPIKVERKAGEEKDNNKSISTLEKIDSSNLKIGPPSPQITNAPPSPRKIRHPESGSPSNTNEKSSNEPEVLKARAHPTHLKTKLNLSKPPESALKAIPAISSMARSSSISEQIDESDDEILPMMPQPNKRSSFNASSSHHHQTHQKQQQEQNSSENHASTNSSSQPFKRSALKSARRVRQHSRNDDEKIMTDLVHDIVDSSIDTKQNASNVYERSAFPQLIGLLPNASQKHSSANKKRSNGGSPVIVKPLPSKGHIYA